MAKIVIDELVTLIGFKTTKESKQALANVENGIRSVKKLALVATGAMAGLVFAMDKIISGVDQQAKFAKGLGLSFENLQRLQFAGQKAGASVSDINSALESLTKTMASTKAGEYNSALLNIGVSARDLTGQLKPASQLLLEISAALENLTPIRQQQFGANFGFSTSTVNFLAQGPKKIVADMKEADRIGGVLPERLGKIAAALNSDAFLKVSTTIKKMSEVIALSFAPALTALLNQFEEWIIKNKEVVASDIGGFIKALSKGFVIFGKIVFKVTDVMSSFASKILGSNDSLDSMKAVTVITTGVLLALAAAVVSASAPFLLMAAGITAVMEVMPNLLGISKALANLYNAVFPSAVDSTTKSIDGASSALERFLNVLSRLQPFSLKSFRKIGDEIGKLADATGIKTLFSSSGVNSVASALQETSKPGGTGALSAIVAKKEASSSLSVPLQNAAGPKSTTTNTVNINVSGAGDPSAVAKEVKTQFDLASAPQLTSPGFQRSKVT